MSLVNRIVDMYSAFVSRHPYIMIILVMLITSAALEESQKVVIGDMDYKTMLPKDIEVIRARDIITDSFGGTDSVTVAVEIDPRYPSSGEPRDIRDPEVMMYVDILSQALEYTDNVVSSSSAATILRAMNGEVLPKSRAEIIALTSGNAMAEQYISADATMTLIKLQITDDADAKEMVADVQETIAGIDRPGGLLVQPAGDIATHPIISTQIPNDMSRTSNISLIGIVLILLILFRSLIFGITPLSAIGFGIMWTFGYIGFRGMNITSATAGVVSMIMGVGIDFGIQVSNRFSQELNDKTIEEAMRASLNYVIIPMLTTTAAALIGFKAMEMGKLTFLGEMGKMMSYGIVACFLAAVTIVPGIMIVLVKFTNLFRRKKLGKAIIDKKINVEKRRRAK